MGAHRRNEQIDALAREIYGLIWTNRDDEAEARLRALGPDAVPVAHALILVDFRWPPLLKQVGYSLIWAFVSGFLVIPLVYSICCDVPATYAEVKWLFYFGLGGGCLLAEMFVGAFLESFLSSRRFVKIRDEADRRKLDAAGIALAESPSRNADLPAAIVDALNARNCIYSPPSNPIDSRLETALTAALQVCTPEVLGDFTQRQRQFLGSKLGTLLGRMSATVRNVVSDADAVELGIAIIRSQIHIPSQYGVEKVRRIAEQSLDATDERWAPLVHFAVAMLPELEESLRRTQGKDVLLRSSDAAKTGEAELLRAHSAQDKTPEDELLRASE